MNLMQAGPSELSEQFVVCVFLCVLMRSSVYQLLSVPHLGTSVVQRGGLLFRVLAHNWNTGIMAVCNRGTTATDRRESSSQSWVLRIPEQEQGGSVVSTHLPPPRWFVGKWRALPRVTH